MPHQHLGFHLLDGFQSNAHYNDDRSSTDSQGVVSHQVARDFSVQVYLEYSHHREEQNLSEGARSTQVQDPCD